MANLWPMHRLVGIPGFHPSSHSQALSWRRLLWSLVMLLVLIGAPIFCLSPAWAESGTLYYLQGGTGGGLVHILSNGKLQKLRWRKDQFDDAALREAESWRPGNIWEYRQEEGWLTWGCPSGQTAIVRQGYNLLNEHFDSLRKGQIRSAYANFSIEAVSRLTLSAFEQQTKSRKLKSDAPVYAFKVIGHNKQQVWILVQGLLVWEKHPKCYRYELQMEKGRLKISAVVPVTSKEFDEA